MNTPSSLTTCARCSCMKPRDGYDLCVNCVHADTVATDLTTEHCSTCGSDDPATEVGYCNNRTFHDRPTGADDLPAKLEDLYDPVQHPSVFAAAARIRELEAERDRLATLALQYSQDAQALRDVVDDRMPLAAEVESLTRQVDHAAHRIVRLEADQRALAAEADRLMAERETLTGDPYSVHRKMQELEAEVTRLTRWKDEAYQVMGDWQKVWEALGRPGKLGTSIAKESLAEVERLTAAIRQAVTELDAMHQPDTRFPKRLLCVHCGARDGSWPCTTRMIADDLRTRVRRAGSERGSAG